ncbi:MAG: CDP-alcohol phosphatidyltransferase family protein [Deltaproteobacteria bacterium]|nr:CDP-alcohol phosphatidyltransferase family protein [Deltaproteobacteria bacterium]
MTDGAPAPPAFDAVLVVHPASEAEVAGLRLLERAAFTLVRAGARRLLCIGAPPRGGLRMPDIATDWVASADASATAAWLARAAASVIGMDAAAIVDRETVVALVADARDTVLAADGHALLWRAPRARVTDVLPQVVALATAATAADVVRAPPPFIEATSWTPPADTLLRPVHDAAGSRVAARALFARLGRPGDGWFTRLVDRRISRALTRLLLPTGVTPNQVTVASIVVGIVAGVLFATGNRAAAIIGAALFLASTIIDGCDGELARITFRESRFGARLDVVGDNVVHVFLFTGIAAGLYRRDHDPRVAVAGWLLLVGVIVAMGAVYACIVRRRPTTRQRALFEAFASREFAYLLFVLTLAGKLEWFLWVSAAGTYAFVVALLALRR